MTMVLVEVGQELRVALPMTNTLECCALCASIYSTLSLEVLTIQLSHVVEVPVEGSSLSYSMLKDLFVWRQVLLRSRPRGRSLYGRLCESMWGRSLLSSPFQ